MRLVDAEPVSIDCKPCNGTGRVGDHWCVCEGTGAEWFDRTDLYTLAHNLGVAGALCEAWEIGRLRGSLFEAWVSKTRHSGAGQIHASAIEVYDRVGRAMIKAAQAPSPAVDLAPFTAAAVAEALRPWRPAHQIESDANAQYEAEQCYEADPDYTIAVDPMTGDVDEIFYVTAREARVLAATLLRAAEQAEMDAERIKRGEYAGSL